MNKKIGQELPGEFWYEFRDRAHEIREEFGVNWDCAVILAALEKIYKDMSR